MILTILFSSLLANADPVKWVTPGPNTIKVAILDGGFDVDRADSNHIVKICNKGHFDFELRQSRLTSGDKHGSVVATAFSEGLEDVDYCIVFYTVFHSNQSFMSGDAIDQKFTNAFRKLLSSGVSAINISISGKYHSHIEREWMRRISRKGIHIFAAAGNDATSLDDACIIYPACYTKVSTIEIVGALNDGWTAPASYSNFGERITEWYYGKVHYNGFVYSGTSFASPRAMSDYVLFLSKVRTPTK